MSLTMSLGKEACPDLDLGKKYAPPDKTEVQAERRLSSFAAASWCTRNMKRDRTLLRLTNYHGVNFKRPGLAALVGLVPGDLLLQPKRTPPGHIFLTF